MTDNISSENFGNVPNHASENLAVFPNHSETNFVPIRKLSERKPTHTLTVREVQRIFEDNEISLSEHTITNWCKQNSQGICKLDGFYDEVERRWYITPESVETAIREERLKLRKDMPNLSEAVQNFSDAFGNVRNDVSESFGNILKSSEATSGKPENGGDKSQKSGASESSANPLPHTDPQVSQATEDNSEIQKIKSALEEANKKIAEQNQKIFDLEVLNKGKDIFVDHMKKIHGDLIENVKQSSEQIGEMKTKILQIESPKEKRGEMPDSVGRIFDEEGNEVRRS